MPVEDESVELAQRAVRAVVGLAVRSIDPALARVTVPQLRVLLYLRANGPMQVGRLTDLLSVTPSSATRFAAKLDRQGWIRRSRLEDDRRAVLLELTGRGTRLVDGVRAFRADALRAAFARMSDADRRSAVAGLALLADALEEPGTGSTLSMLDLVDPGPQDEDR